MKSDDGGPILLFGGVAVVIAMGSIAFKAMERFFNQLSNTIDAFGKVVSSFFPMLLNVLEIVGLVAVIILVAVAGVYFTVRYVRMVRRATAIQAYVDEALNRSQDQFFTKIEKEVVSKIDRLTQRTQVIEFQIAKLLKPVTLGTPIQSSTKPSEQNISQIGPDPLPFTREKVSSTQEVQIPVSQPY